MSVFSSDGCGRDLLTTNGLPISLACQSMSAGSRAVLSSAIVGA